MLAEKVKGPLAAPSSTPTSIPGGSRDLHSESLRIAIEVLGQHLGRLRSFPQQAVAPLLCLESALRRRQTLPGSARGGGSGAAGASGEPACVNGLAAAGSPGGGDIGRVSEVSPVSDVLLELLLSLMRLPGLGLLLSLRCTQVNEDPHSSSVLLPLSGQ